eukprot:TRINITY_DN24648_c0_g1_i1.p1 TRINITY_DN24648_c0_g1~~TRINITY_DN24648_c0_g1_i1.p1  ORF type:complete len:880 (-),score=166.85 TRINITY_DN24648_c0_g1_i1:267-2906(-)
MFRHGTLLLLCCAVLALAAEEDEQEPLDSASASSMYTQSSGFGLGPEISAKEIAAPPPAPLPERPVSTDEIPPPDAFPRQAIDTADLDLKPPPPPRSVPLVLAGVGLAVSCFLATAVLSVMLLTALAGLPVPVLAAMPSASAAMFAIQLLSLVGSKESAPPPLANVAQALTWVAPQRPDTTLMWCILALFIVWVLRRMAAHRHRTSLELAGPGGTAGKIQELPHCLAPGSWESRALGLLAFPLSAASTELMLHLDMSDSPVAGFLVALVVLSFLATQAVTAQKFVSEALHEGRVIRAKLPEGHEVFVDRVCNQLRALPMSPATPAGCALLFNDWLDTPSWRVTPAVAAIEQMEFPEEQIEAGGLRFQHDRPGHISVGTWCSGESSSAQTALEEEDELQDLPLLEGKAEDDKALEDERDLEASSHSRSSASTDKEGKNVPPDLLITGGPSEVKLAHPVVISTTLCYEVPARDALAGVSCIPWLDCAVPANVLRRIEELCGPVVLRAHPTQLVGELTAGQYAACFDWGVHSPWCWPSELAAKTVLGAWAALPRSSGDDAMSPSLVVLIDCAMVFVTAAFAFLIVRTRCYEHRNDNTAVRMAYLAAMQVVSIRASWDPANQKHGPLTAAAAGAAAVFALIPCVIALLSGVGLAITALNRLEAQGLQDHLLPVTVTGWNSKSARSCIIDRDVSVPSICDVGNPSQSSQQDAHDVEVIMPGARKAFAILLPARSRLAIQHSQLLPPVPGRAGEPEMLPPCTAIGDRARMPIPPRFLFPAGQKSEKCSLEAPPAPPGVVPLAALLAPGRLGRLIYFEASHNEAGASWEEAVSNFFGMNGSLLAEEAERLISQALETAGSQRKLVVIEVLPAFASEFMDERNAPPE